MGAVAGGEATAMRERRINDKSASREMTCGIIVPCRRSKKTGNIARCHLESQGDILAAASFVSVFNYTRKRGRSKGLVAGCCAFSAAGLLVDSAAG